MDEVPARTDADFQDLAFRERDDLLAKLSDWLGFPIIYEVRIDSAAVEPRDLRRPQCSVERIVDEWPAAITAGTRRVVALARSAPAAC